MAISLGKYKAYGAKATEAERQAKVYAKEQKKAKSRRGLSGMLGQIIGTLGGTFLSTIPGVGALLAPALMGLGKFAGKKIGHELTRGMAADPSKLKAEDKYGFGKESAKTLRESLEMQRAEDPFQVQGGLGQDILGGYMAAGIEEGGWKNMLEKVGKKGSLYSPIKGTADKVKRMADKALTGDQIDVTDILKKHGTEMSTFGVSEETPEGLEAISQDTSDPFPQEWQEGGLQFMNPETLFPGINKEDWIKNEKFRFQQGGMVQEQATTISDYFNMRGKSLGGSNKQSLAEMLGRR